VPLSLIDLQDFQSIFSGNQEAYGVHIYSSKKTKGKKEEGENYTKVQPVTEQQYQEHLNGKTGLGLIPIRNDNTCKFAILDIDTYDQEIISSHLDFIYEYDVPVIPFKSKSGGLHVYLFLEVPVAANAVKNYMSQIATLLGLTDKTEIFPKQATLIAGQVGNWINLPYYNLNKSCALNRDGTDIIFEQAIIYIKDHTQTEQSLLQYFENLPLADGPCCLQHIYLKKETNFRNEYLFSLTCYYKAKYGDDFEFKISEANNHLTEPISIGELQKTIITTHKKKDYTYKCGTDPILSFCNKVLCKTKQYGVGGQEISNLDFEEFIQYTSDPPYYEWIINNKSLRFFSELEIIQQQRFRALCFRDLHLLPNRIKDSVWTRIINQALENITIKQINSEEDISPGTLFKEHLVEFLEKRAPAKSRQQILVDRVYKDRELNQYVFKAQNLVTFLISQKQFRFYGTTEIQVKLKELGGAPKKFYIDKHAKSTRVWILPFTALEKFIDEERLEDTTITFEEEHEDEPF